MALDIEYSEGIQLAASIFEIFSAVHHSVLLLYHIPHVLTNTKDRKGAKRRPSNIEILSVIYMCSIAIGQFWEGTIRWNPLPYYSDITCSWTKKFSACMYALCKALMYLLFLERTYSAFADSVWAFSNWIKCTVRTVGCLYLLILWLLVVLQVDGEFDPVTDVCRIILPPFLSVIAIVSDMFIVLAISITFCRRLLLLNMSMTTSRMMSPSPSIRSTTFTPKTPTVPMTPTSPIPPQFTLNSDTIHTMDTISPTTPTTPTTPSIPDTPTASTPIPETRRTMSLDTVSRECFTYDVLQKTLVLTTIALLTTPMSLILGAIVGMVGFWVSVDFMISCWMVMLMFAKHNWIYEHLCEHLEVMVTVNCLSIYSCYHCEDYFCFCSHQLDQVIEASSNSPREHHVVKTDSGEISGMTIHLPDHNDSTDFAAGQRGFSP